MALTWIHFYNEDFPLPAWDIASQIVGDGYVPYATEKNGHAGGRHVMDDFGSLVQALPQDHHDLKQRDWRLAQFLNWGPQNKANDATYYYH